MSEHRSSRLAQRNRRAALVAAVLIAAATTFTFAKGSLLGGGGYEVRAVVSDANQLRPGGDVRIGGVRVGEVAGIEAGPGATSVLRLRVGDRGRPVRSDATITVKPRLVLEGNAYVDLSPGTPAGAELADGATIGLARTAVTPQLDQVLGVLDAPTRGALHQSIAQLAEGLDNGRGDGPGLAGSGARGLRRAVKELDGALGDVRRATRALRGTRPGDLPRAVRHSGDVAAQLAARPRSLADGVTAFARTMDALADEGRGLRASIRGFDEVLRAAPSSLRRVDAALPPLRRFAGALRPGLRAAPGALHASNRLLDELGAATRPRELPRLVDRLAPVTARLPRFERRLRALFGFTDQVTGCLGTHVIPTFNQKIQDGRHTTGDPAWLDLLHSVTGFTSASTSYDGNGGTFRAGLAFGPTPLTGVVDGLGVIAGHANQEIAGVRPVWLGYGVEPPYRPDARCADQELPQLNVDAGPPPAWARLRARAATAKGGRP